MLGAYVKLEFFSELTTGTSLHYRSLISLTNLQTYRQSQYDKWCDNTARSSTLPMSRRQNRTTFNMAANGAAAAPAAALIDTLPGPGIFRGRPTEHGLDWLAKFELWSRCRSCPEEVMVAAFQLHLEEGAATWMHALPDTERDTWYHLRAAFVARYGPNRNTGWQRASELWAMQQTANETALDFADRVQRLAREADVAVDVTMGAILNGLRPSLRGAIIRQNPADLTALRAAARNAEMTEMTSSENNAEAIRRIEQQLQQLTLHAMTSSADRGRPASRDRDRQTPPSRSPSWDRRTNADRRQQQPSYDRRPPHLRDAFRGRQQGDYRRQQDRPSRTPAADDDAQSAPRQHDQGDGDVDRRQENFRYRRSQSPAAERHVTFAETRDGRARQSFPPCDSCGRKNHPRSRCYYRNAECAFCGRVGHIQDVCRAARH